MGYVCNFAISIDYCLESYPCTIPLSSGYYLYLIIKFWIVLGFSWLWLKNQWGKWFSFYFFLPFLLLSLLLLLLFLENSQFSNLFPFNRQDIEYQQLLLLLPLTLLSYWMMVNSIYSSSKILFQHFSSIRFVYNDHYPYDSIAAIVASFPWSGP